MGMEEFNVLEKTTDEEKQNKRSINKNNFMYIIREIFHLQFGRYREAKALIDEGMQKKLLLQPPGFRVLTDFTGEGYRLILELPYATLTDYETGIGKELSGTGWAAWYEKFKSLIRYSEREILKQVI
jgi:hypothetical protein